ncbi:MULTISPECIES: hypothetical protein [Clostridium]|nr:MULTISPECIES: hypothetical protein [Clostridium]
MAYRTDCYKINKHYELDKEKVKKAFQIILNAKVKEKLEKDKITSK